MNDGFAAHPFKLGPFKQKMSVCFKNKPTKLSSVEFYDLDSFIYLMTPHRIAILEVACFTIPPPLFFL